MKTNGLKQKKNRSLKRVVFVATLIGALIFLIVITILEADLIIFPTLAGYKRELEHEAAYIENLLGSKYVPEYIQAVRNVYENTPEEIRKDEFSDEYIECLVPLVDETFWKKRDILTRCRENTEMDTLLLCFFDEKHERLVVVIDGNEDDKAFLPGQWISDEIGDIDSLKIITKTLNSDWFMPISYGKVSGWSASDYYGLYDDEGNILGYISMNVSIRDVASQINNFLMIFFPIVVALIIFVLYFESKFIVRRFLSPLGALERAARKASAIDTEAEAEITPHFKDLDMNTGDEFESLWKTMVKMEDDIASAVIKIRDQAAKQQRIETELDVAKNIQLSAIPSTFPAFPDRSEFDIFASMTPAKEVGGDFYDFFLIDENHLGMVIADVSDKGVPAALFMMMSKSLLRARAMEGGKPSAILSYVNRGLCKDNDNMMFVTIWFGILEISSGKVIAANAGHEYPFVTDEEGTYHTLDDPHGLMCGVYEDVEYEDYEFTVPKDGKIFVYTDGLPEAHRSSDEMLGLEKTGELLNKYKGLPPMEIVQRMHEEVDSFSGEGNQFDDLTMLCMQYLGK